MSLRSAWTMGWCETILPVFLFFLCDEEGCLMFFAIGLFSFLYGVVCETVLISRI